jgi:hypothetical protein
MDGCRAACRPRLHRAASKGQERLGSGHGQAMHRNNTLYFLLASWQVASASCHGPQRASIPLSSSQFISEMTGYSMSLIPPSLLLQGFTLSCTCLSCLPLPLTPHPARLCPLPSFMQDHEILCFRQRAALGVLT